MSLQRPFACPEPGCHKSFVRRGHLNRHRVTHGERNFKCEQCDLSFFYADKLRAHVRSVHEEHPPTLPCSHPGCELMFRKRSQLRAHEMSHRGPNPYKCLEEGCGMAFPSKRKLGIHHKRHSNGYKCTWAGCTKGFSSWTAMLRHRQEHTKDVRCICSECGKELKTRGKLREHLRVHSSETYPCPVADCTKIYASVSARNAHVAAHHEGRSFSCPVLGCGRKFRYKAGLERHVARGHDAAGQPLRRTRPAPPGPPKRTPSSQLTGVARFEPRGRVVKRSASSLDSASLLPASGATCVPLVTGGEPEGHSGRTCVVPADVEPLSAPLLV